MKQILPGSLTQQATIQRYVLIEVNAFGEEIYQWLDIAVIRCSIRQSKQKDNKLQRTIGTHTVGLRYLQMELNDRLVLKAPGSNEDIYTILEIENIDFSDRYLILNVEKTNTRVEYIPLVEEPVEDE